jgi:hypothetical protein
MTPTMRILENDDSYISLYDVYEKQCATVGISREEATIQASEKIRAILSRQDVCIFIAYS